MVGWGPRQEEPWLLVGVHGRRSFEVGPLVGGVGVRVDLGLMAWVVVQVGGVAAAGEVRRARG